MSKSLEHTINSIIPTASSIPRELTQFATSLLNQSRNRIGSLNGEEETAREYICAHIACERLKLKHNLPTLQSRPPIRPRIYNNLYKYFSDTLTAAKSAPNTPKKSRDAHTSPSTTPTAARTQKASTLTTQNSPRRPKSQFHPSTSTSKAKTHSDQYMDFIDKLCASRLSTKLHVVRGFDYIASSFKYQTLASEPRLLLAALFLAVYVRISGEWNEGFNVDEEQTRYETYKRRALDIIGENVEGGAFEGIMMEIMSDGMTESAWFQDIPLAEDDVDEDIEEEEDEEELGEEGVTTKGESMVIFGKGAPGGSKKMEPAGVGTMLQDRVNYLGAKRRRHYTDWEARILQRIAETEA